MREEFSAIWTSPVLYQLESHHLLEAIKSDYLQLSELEVLQSVIKWGENRLVRRMEERGAYHSTTLISFPTVSSFIFPKFFSVL